MPLPVPGVAATSTQALVGRWELFLVRVKRWSLQGAPGVTHRLALALAPESVKGRALALRLPSASRKTTPVHTFSHAHICSIF